MDAATATVKKGRMARNMRESSITSTVCYSAQQVIVLSMKKDTGVGNLSESDLDSFSVVFNVSLLTADW